MFSPRPSSVSINWQTDRLIGRTPLTLDALLLFGFPLLLTFAKAVADETGRNFIENTQSILVTFNLLFGEDLLDLRI